MHKKRIQLLKLFFIVIINFARSYHLARIKFIAFFFELCSTQKLVQFAIKLQNSFFHCPLSLCQKGNGLFVNVHIERILHFHSMRTSLLSFLPFHIVADDILNGNFGVDICSDIKTFFFFLWKKLNWGGKALNLQFYSFFSGIVWKGCETLSSKAKLFKLASWIRVKWCLTPECELIKKFYINCSWKSLWNGFFTFETEGWMKRICSWWIFEWNERFMINLIRGRNLRDFTFCELHGSGIFQYFEATTTDFFT